MALPNARDHYLKTQVETASKEQLVVMLFDGIIRFTDQARKSIENNQIEESHHALMRAQAIVMELICTVDKDQGGEVAKNLMGLHAYAFNCLIMCNMQKDVSKIDEVQKIYRQLREGWVGAMDTLGIAANAPVGAPSGVSPLPPKPTGTVPAAKTAPLAATPRASGSAPGSTGGPGGGILASGVKPATGYGMGRTMAMGAYGKPAPVAAPQTVAAPAPAAAAHVAPAPAKPVMNAKQAAMLSAYGAGSRNIA